MTKAGRIVRGTGLLPFGLERGEEAFHGGIFPDIAGPAHRAGDAIVSHQPLELLTGILAALVRMMQQGIWLAPPPDRHDQRVGNELGCHGVAHRPADHPTGVQVDNGQVEPSLRSADIGKVGHPLLVGPVCRELAIQHVACDDRAFALIFRQSATSGPRLQPQRRA